MTSLKYLFLLFFGVLFAQSALAQPEKWGLPPSPNGKLISALLDAVNESDADVHRKFLETHFAPDFLEEMPLETHLEYFSQMHQDLAGAEVNGVDMIMDGASNPTLKVLMKTPADAYWHLMIDVLQGDAPQIAGLSVEESADGPPPAEQMIDALLAAINASDSEVHRDFIEQYFAPAFKNDLPMEDHLGQFQQLHQDLAGAEVASVEAMSRGGSDETIMMLMVTNDGKKFNLSFDMQLSTPPRLITLTASPQ